MLLEPPLSQWSLWTKSAFIVLHDVIKFHLADCHGPRIGCKKPGARYNRKADAPILDTGADWKQIGSLTVTFHLAEKLMTDALMNTTQPQHHQPTELSFKDKAGRKRNKLEQGKAMSSLSPSPSLSTAI
jgi:hypothetical protein